MGLEGLSVPIPTLFGDNGELDSGRNSRFTRGLCESKVDHVFALGSLGEFPLLTDPERAKLLESVIESVTWKTDAWVGCGAPSTAQAVRYAVSAEEAGAAAVVCVPPYYLHPTIGAVEKYYRTIRQAIGIPLLAYNIPSLVGYGLPPPLVHRLGSERVLAGIKDTSGSLESVTSFLAGAPEGFVVLPGDDSLASASIAQGAAGAIMGSANVVPKLAVELVSAARARDTTRAQELQSLVDRLVTVIRAGPFPQTDKFLISVLRGAPVGYRSPYDALTPTEEATVRQALESVEADLKSFL